MKITVLNILDLANYEGEDKTFVIKMTSLPSLKLKNNFLHLKEYFFDDINDDINKSNYMSEEEAISILENCILAKKTCDEIVLSCDYDQGRSVAVAIFYDEFFNDKKYHKELINKFPNINIHILSKLKEVLSDNMIHFMQYERSII